MAIAISRNAKLRHSFHATRAVGPTSVCPTPTPSRFEGSQSRACVLSLEDPWDGQTVWVQLLLTQADAIIAAIAMPQCGEPRQ